MTDPYDDARPDYAATAEDFAPLNRKETTVSKTAIQPAASTQLATPLSSMLQPLPVDQVVRVRNSVLECMKRTMKRNVHYGTIPGTQNPTLLKKGAQLLCTLFRFAPRYHVLERTCTDEEISYEIACEIVVAGPAGVSLGSAVGSCSSKESRYRYLKGHTCPECGADTVGGPTRKAQDWLPKGGYYCAKGKGGCGSKFYPGSEAAEKLADSSGKVERKDVADVGNTVFKMAAKRALVDAVQQATGCGDLWSVDPEDIPDGLGDESRVDRPQQREDTPEERKLVAQIETLRQEANDPELFGEVGARLRGCWNRDPGVSERNLRDLLAELRGRVGGKGDAKPQPKAEPKFDQQGDDGLPGWLDGGEE